MSEEYNEEYKGTDETEPEQSGTVKAIKSGLKFARSMMLLIMAVAALILIFVNRDKINADNLKRLLTKIDMGTMNSQTADNTVIDFEYDSSGIIDVYKDGLARITSDNLVIMDNIGTQFQSVITGYNDPAMITTDKYVLIYDRGGKKLSVTNSFTVLFETSFDDNIVNVSMNENGYFAVITESEAYKNKLIVYNSNFNEVYRINSLTRYFICADISSDNRYIAVSSLYIKDSNVTPQINCYKLTSEESIWNRDFEDDIAVDIVCENDGSFSALFEWGICVLDSKGNEKYCFEFENRILQNYYMKQDKYNIAVMSESISGASEITVFNNNGKQIGNIVLNDTALSVDLYHDRIAVLTRSEIMIYSVSGNLVSSRKNPNDGTKILFSGKNSILSVSASGVVYNLFD